jgi:hypothetical protein
MTLSPQRLDKAAEAVRYLIDPLSPFPKRWTDPHGPVRVMCEPADGYVMCRRPHGRPFVLSVRQILNTERHSVHGPFTPIGKAARTLSVELTERDAG